MHILAPHFILIMQGCVGNVDAADKHRLQSGHRCQRAGASHLHINTQHDAGGLLGRKFVRNGKPRCPGDKTQLLLRCQTVDLIDHTVDVVRQAFTRAANLAVVIQQTLQTVDDRAFWRNEESIFLKIINYLTMKS